MSVRNGAPVEHRGTPNCAPHGLGERVHELTWCGPHRDGAPSISLRQSLDALGPVLAFRGNFRGRQTFEVVRRALEFAFAPGTDVELDLASVAAMDQINLGLFASMLIQRAADTGRCRLILPTTGDGHRLLEWFMGYTLRISLDDAAQTVTVDLGVRQGDEGARGPQ